MKNRIKGERKAMENVKLLENNETSLVGGDDTSLLKNHNIRVYYDLKSALAQYDSIVLETCTGSGKSYVTVQLCKNFMYKALILVPKLSIGNQWDNLLSSSNVEYTIMTYHAFSRLNTEDALSLEEKYQILITDEAHHVSAQHWRKNIKILKDRHIIKILGLTADTIRWTDNKLDVSVDMFDYKVSGYDLGEAIDLDILSTFEYICSVFNAMDIYSTIDEKFTNTDGTTLKLKGKLLSSLQNILSAKDILKKHLDNSKHKIIVFAEDIDSCETAKEYISEFISRVYTINTSFTKEDNKTQLNAFNNDNDCAIICVNMLNEGVHVNGVDTLVMLRKTMAPNMLIQWIGRAMSAGSGIIPKIFDFVGNATNVMAIEDFNMQKIGKGSATNWIGSISPQVIVHDYVKDINELINTIRWLHYANRPWIELEDDFIRENIAKMTVIEIAKVLGRHYGCVYRRVHFLELDEFLRLTYTDDIDSIIRDVWADESVNMKSKTKVVSELTGLKKSQIQARANKLGVTIKSLAHWSDEDRKVVLDNLDKCSYPEIVELLDNRYTVDQIEAMLNHQKKLGNIEYGSKRHIKTIEVDRWIEENGDKFRECFSKYGNNWRFYNNEFPDMKQKTLARYATYMGLVKPGENRGNSFTYEELIQLKEDDNVTKFLQHNDRHTYQSVSSVLHKIRYNQIDFEKVKEREEKEKLQKATIKDKEPAQKKRNITYRDKLGAK